MNGQGTNRSGRPADPAKKLAAIIKAIVQEFILHAEDLQVEVTGSNTFATMSIKCHSADRGRVIGTNGETAIAINKLAMLIGRKDRLTVKVLPITVSVQGPADRYPKFQERTDWRKTEIVGLIETVAWNIFRQDQAVIVGCIDDGPVSTVTIDCAGDEPLRLLDDATVSLNTLFTAVGKPNGRTIQVVIKPGKAEPAQPQSSERR